MIAALLTVTLGLPAQVDCAYAPQAPACQPPVVVIVAPDRPGEPFVVRIPDTTSPGQRIEIPVAVPGTPVVIVVPREPRTPATSPTRRFRRLTNAQARALVERRLRQAYGRRAYRTRCTTTRSGRASTCTTTWRDQRQRYRATSRVTRSRTNLTRTRITIRARPR